MSGESSITIKQLHAKTGDIIRRAGKSRHPVGVTDRGKLVAMLVAPDLVPVKNRRRTLLPEYAVLLGGPTSRDVLEDLDVVRGDR